MSQAKQDSKRKGRTKAATVLGVAGALSLASGAFGAAVGTPGDTLTERTAITESAAIEEISDVSLSTFYAFDHDNAGAYRSGFRLAQKVRPSRRGCGGCGSCSGCGGCSGGPTSCASCASAGGPDGM